MRAASNSTSHHASDKYMDRVAYIWSPALQDACDQLPSNLNRSTAIHDLHRAYDLLDSSDLTVYEPDLTLGDVKHLTRFHDRDYIDRIQEAPQNDTNDEEYGLAHDCPVFTALPDYISLVAAATSTACQLLVDGETDIAINWDGGRHHAQRGRASGFCYVADIVLGMMLLAKSRIEGRRPRILYLDLDIHNGDGVAKAFASPTHFTKDTERPPQVLTFSIHHSSPVFFPAPTSLPPPDTPNPFTLSVPLAAFPSSQTYERLYHDCVDPVRLAFKPDYVVLQLGTDGLPADPIGKWGAWSVDGPGGMAWYAEKVQAWGVPMCILGGGGYNNANAARAWTTVTSRMTRRAIAKDIPHHDHFALYEPSFTMDIETSNAKDENTSESLASARENIRAIADRIERIVGIKR